MTEARFFVDLFFLQTGDAKVLVGRRATSSLSGETVQVILLADVSRTSQRLDEVIRY